MDNIVNVYEDETRAESYAKLDFPGTYYLAYRDLPEIIQRYKNGNKALDFGCGTGRSTRFLQKLRFETTGIDISNEMIQMARKLDPIGNYLLISDGNFNELMSESFDIILSVFTFDNIPFIDKRIRILSGLKGLLKSDGKLILVDSTPEIYQNEWASFSTINFPENKYAKSGEEVYVIMNDVDDKRPVKDFIWYHEDYTYAFSKSGLRIKELIYPLGNTNENIQWKTETTIAPWVIYVLEKNRLLKNV